MRKDTPIVIVGAGSIGERHFRNLRTLGFTTVAIYDTDTSRARVLGATALPRLTVQTLKAYKVVFVCNPTTDHVRVARMAIRAGCHVFIEKPLSHTTKGLASLLRETHERNLVALVACNFRFHPEFVRLQKKLQSGTLGKPLSALVTFTRQLARPGVKYQKTYAAQKLGGGVLFDLGPHVLEYMGALFGEYVSVSAVLAKHSSLAIAAEDFAAGVLTQASGVRTVFELDYYSDPKRHRIEVQCEGGSVVADFTREDDRNAMYLAQLRHFIACIDGKEKPAYNLVRAALVIKVLESIRRSAKVRKTISV